MYRIGEFSFINKVSVKTLRFYDTIDLFKPKIVDEFTGYRYYSDDQQEVFDEIMKYKRLGFSLDEINKIIHSDEEKKKLIVDRHLYDLNKKMRYDESQKRLLKNMLNDVPRIEFNYYFHKPCYMKRFILKDRNVDDLYEEIKKDLTNQGFKTYRRLFVNFEIGYCDKDIDALIGYEVNEKKGELEGYKLVWADLKTKSLIGHGSKDEIDDIYKDMIEYSKKNNIQIRGIFGELYDGDSVEVAVEAFDLDEVNEDQIYYLDHYKPECEIDDSLVGKYKILEILPSVHMFKPGRQKSIPDTRFDILELHSDGTTNIDDIKWAKKALLLNYDNRIIPIHYYPFEREGKKYLEVHFNEDYKYYKSQRPMFYIYERIDD